MNKQDKQIIIDDFKKVIDKLTLRNIFICCILDDIGYSTTRKYFKSEETLEKAEKFTLASDIPESWSGGYSWWEWTEKGEKIEVKKYKQKILDLKISFLESLIKELEEE